MSDAVICQTCSSRVLAHEKFCSNCGQPVAQPAATLGLATSPSTDALAPAGAVVPTAQPPAVGWTASAPSEVTHGVWSVPLGGAPWGATVAEGQAPYLPQPGPAVAPPAQVPPQPPQIYIQNTVQQNQQINVTPLINVVLLPRHTPFIIRAIWFVCIGWWLTGLMIGVGYLAMITIVGIPLALYLFHRIPQALTLRERSRSLQYETRGGATYITEANMIQQAWYLRAAFFLLIGWWFGGIWLVVAYILSILVLTLPLGVMMFNRAGGAFTLQRH